MIDLICYRHYDGRQAGAVSAVLEANRDIGLAEMPPVLPPGLKIVLPVLETPASSGRIVLW